MAPESVEISQEVTTARLIVNALLEHVDQVRLGLIANMLPPFDVSTLCQLLQSHLSRIRLALIDFDNIAIDSASRVATQVETVIGWRNDPELTEKLIVILNAAAQQEKTHSLEVLEPFTDEDLRRAICRQAEQEAQDDPLRQQLWHELRLPRTEKYLPLVARQVAELYHALQTADVATTLPHIGLLPDPEITNYEFAQRIKQNRNHVIWLLTLDGKDYRMLARALADEGDTDHRHTFRHIKQYTQNPTQEHLVELTLDSVIHIRKAEKAPEPSADETHDEQPSAFQPRSLPSSVYLVDQLLKLNPLYADYQQALANINHQAERIADMFYEDIAEEYEADLIRVREAETSEVREQRESYEVLIDLQTQAEVGSVRPPTEKEELHPLHEFIPVWVHPQSWGGRIQVDNLSDETLDIAGLVADESSSLPFIPFMPLDTQREHSLFNLFDALDRLVGDVNGGDTLVTLLQTLHTHRQLLTHYRTLFLYYPDQAVQAPNLRPAIQSYLETYHRLAQRLQQICRQKQVTSPDSTERAMAQFLALDVVIVELWYATKAPSVNALLTPLHPLHLWKWVRLNDLLYDNPEPLGEKALATVKMAAHHLPTILNTFLLHEHMFAPPRRLLEARLVFAGEIDNSQSPFTVGIPYYKPVAQQSPTADGLQSFVDLFDRFLTLYPPARLGLTLVLIDPPQLSPILQKLVQLQKLEMLYSAKVYVYRTNERIAAHDVWQSKDDEALQLFRENPRWILQVSLKQNKLDDIQRDLREKTLYPHIILLCDPSEAIVQDTYRYVQEAATPFGIPVQLSYDSISDAIKLIPAPGGGIFDSYAGVRNTLSGELQRKVLGVGNKGVNPEHLRPFLDDEEGTHWFAIIDWPHGTMELPPGIGRRLAWHRVGARTLAVHTNERDWQKYWQEQLVFALREMKLPAGIDPQNILERLLELFPILPEGLIALIRPSLGDNYHQAFASDVLCELLSVLVVLNWYQQDKAGLALIRLDEGFADWYDAEEEAVKYAAFWLDSDALHVDVMTVHPLLVGYDSVPPLAQARQPLTALSQFATTLQHLFTDEIIITPIRRALLRERLTTAVFASSSSEPGAIMSQTRTTKAAWAQAINGLFSGDYMPHIRLLDIRVALQEKSQVVDQQVYRAGDDDYQRLIVRLPGSYLQPTQPTETDTVTDQQTVRLVLEEQVVKTPSESVTEQPAIMPKKTTLVREQVERQAEELRRVLIAYGIAIASIDTEKSQVGSRFIRYWVKLQPPAGRLSEIQKYAEDIARELGSKTLPLIDNIPGERYVGIDLAREEPETGPLKKGLAQLPTGQPNQLLVAMGENVAGEAVQLDLARLPHMLVAGQTGSGKTVFLATLITSLVWQHPADQLHLILVDPKQMDFGIFAHLSHLYNGRVLYEPADAVTVLRNLLQQERPERTQLLHKARCPNILEYNRRHPEQRLPWIVVVIDEFADIMLSLNPKERSTFEKQINRLAATGRAVGIHLVIATQRPTTEVITGTIKANIPARVSFRLPSQIDSRTVLDRPGAENLLGQGDMLVAVNNEVQRLQGYYASYDEFVDLLDNPEN
ncbi:MAG: DUF87 domain-containing protein [Chloroflexi bacterium]|nr:DUF87 domain-containing protein [Nitrososphaera sp.]MCI0645436.1 DUF87 domain-containing protein [Chloroflexota bacterium]MCI0731302.1 DUF87 domain-containing protein [Chloroflexota bacterium]